MFITQISSLSSASRSCVSYFCFISGRIRRTFPGWQPTFHTLQLDTTKCSCNELGPSGGEKDWPHTCGTCSAAQWHTCGVDEGRNQARPYSETFVKASNMNAFSNHDNVGAQWLGSSRHVFVCWPHIIVHRCKLENDSWGVVVSDV